MSYPLGVWGFIVLSYCVIVGASNAVNLTDGLDGLAIMPTVMVGAALGVFAYVTGRADFSTYLFLPHIPGAGELTVFCAAIAGAGLGFLWFNAYPAEVFMGDVGALALGAALGAIAVIVRQEIVLVHHGRRLRRRDAVGGDPGRVVQAHRPARLPHGADPSSLRAQGMEGESGRGAVLDHHHAAGAVRPVDVEAAL